MTSTAKSSATPAVTTTQFADGNGIDFADFAAAFAEVDALINTVQSTVSVTANDTHIKNLDDALGITGTGLAKAVGSPGGNEVLNLSLDAKLQAIIAFLTAGGKVQATGLDSGAAPNGHLATANGTGGTTYVAPGGGGAQPIDVTGTAGETLAARDFVFLDSADSKWYKIDTNASPIKISAIRGVATGAITINTTGQIRLAGLVSGFTGLTAWGRMYASTTAGGFTQTKPSVTAGGGQIAVIDMGFADSTTEMVVMPQQIEYHKRESLVNDASLTILHHSDPQGRKRAPRAYVASTATGASLAAYGSGNQDSNVHLSSKTVATYGTDQCTGGTPTASSTLGGFNVTDVFDNNTATMWASNSTQVAWVEYQFATTKAIRQYKVTARSDGGLQTQSPGTFTFEYWDGAAWVVVDTRASQTYTAGETKTFTFSANVTSTRWRINVTATQAANFVSIAEMEMMEVATYTDGATKLAQSFQVTGTQTIDLARAWLKKIGTPAGTMTLRIETDSAGSPSGTLVDANATVTVGESGLSASYALITFDFGTNFSVSGSTTYWLVLSTSRSTDEFNYVDWGADASSPGYASGQMKSFAGSWSVESKDAVFEVQGQGTTFDEPCTVGRASAGTRDIGVRYDDGAGASGDTNTTFANKSGGTLDVTCVLEVA
jgi:hypothetical protein